MTHMKNIRLFLAAAVLLAACLFADAKNITVNADDSRIVYVGRTACADGAVSFDWSGVTARVAFTGTRLSVKSSDTHVNYFNVWIDKPAVAKEDFVIKTEGDQDIEIAKGLKKGAHTVILQKRTEGEQGTVTFKSFVTDGEFTQAQKVKDRVIEFIGDSYSCGYGTEAADRSEPFRAAEENCNLSYDCIIGRYFDADVNLICHSGLGLVRNYNENKKYTTMTEKYSQIYDMHSEEAWTPDMASYKPDIVVIYLGTNDFSVSRQPSLEVWCSTSVKLLRKIRDFYGEEIPILCVASDASDVLGDYVRQAVERCGMANVAWTSIQKSAHNDTSDLGASWHPNYAGMRKVASCMIPYISTLTGWEMPFKPVE